MKKKLLLLAIILFTGIMSVSAQRIRIDFGVQFDDPINAHTGPHRSPVDAPIVDLDDHTLYFTTSCVGDTLQLVQNDVVVYSIVISDDEVELPASLEGTFEIRIIEDEWLFYGEIEL